jgi:hypothetical protein
MFERVYTVSYVGIFDRLWELFTVYTYTVCKGVEYGVIGREGA